MVNQGGALLAALPPRSFLRSTVPCRGLPQRLPDSPIQCARRSCASDRGGGRFAGTPPGPPRSRDPRGAGCQSCPQAEGTRVEGQVSRPGAHHPTGGATRARVRVDEYPETPRGEGSVWIPAHRPCSSTDGGNLSGCHPRRCPSSARAPGWQPSVGAGTASSGWMSGLERERGVGEVALTQDPGRPGLGRSVTSATQKARQVRVVSPVVVKTKQKAFN